MNRRGATLVTAALLLGIPRAPAAAAPSPLAARQALTSQQALAARPSPPGDTRSIAATVAALESMGNRATNDKQWEAARWIASRFGEMGLSVMLPTYEHAGQRWPNVVATLEGRERPEEVILAIAHLDSTSSDAAANAPGADDDGSGVAVLLELARQLRARPLARTMRFAVFSNEEEGRLGSLAFAREARASGARILAVVNFDVLGYAGPSRADWRAVADVGSARMKLRSLRSLAASLIRSMRGRPAGVQVAGQPANAGLVRAVAGRLGGDPALEVSEVVQQDCG